MHSEAIDYSTGCTRYLVIERVYDIHTQYKHMQREGRSQDTGNGVHRWQAGSRLRKDLDLVHMFSLSVLQRYNGWYGW